MFKDEDFCVKYFDSLNDLGEFRKFLVENGIQPNDEEVNALVELTKAQIAKEERAEFSEADLDDVSGGMVGLALVVTAIVIAYQIYKIKTSQIYNGGKNKA